MCFLVCILDLPAIVFDPASEAYKIFSASKVLIFSIMYPFAYLPCLPGVVFSNGQDWNNQSEPYALGFLALRRRSTFVHVRSNHICSQCTDGTYHTFQQATG